MNKFAAIMGPFDKMTSDQVMSFYNLVKCLRRLRVVGVLQVKTVAANHDIESIDYFDLIDMTTAIYSVRKIGYSRDFKAMDEEERIEKYFGKLPQHLRGAP